MAKFKFERQLDGSYMVMVRKRRWEPIGRIWPVMELGGRHSFILDWDASECPRTYRSMELAGHALLLIHDLVIRSKREFWPSEKLIAMAWEIRPRASLQKLQ